MTKPTAAVTEGQRTIDPDAYARRATPVPREEAEAALAAFDADVRAAMEKHGIAEVAMISAKYVTGSPTPLVSLRQQGDLENCLRLAALHLAMLRRQHRDYMDTEIEELADPSGIVSGKDDEP